MGRLKLKSEVPAEHREEVLAGLRWVDQGLTQLEFDPGDASVVHYAYEGQMEPEDLVGRLTATADRLVGSLRLVPPKVWFQNEGPPASRSLRPYEELLRKGWVIPVADGAHVYTGVMYNLLRALDARFHRVALSLELPVADYRFPGMIDLETLRRAGYLESFPHHVNCLSHLPEQAEAIEGLADHAAGNEASAPACAMSPTVCYHFYVCHQNRKLRGNLIGGTAVSPCYRYEGGNTAGLSRLREFNMREIMFIGEELAVKSARAELLACMKRMLQLCNLRSVMQTASDPFFLDGQERKRIYQMSFELKHEARAWLPGEGTWLAIGSVNYHQDRFGRVFNIRTKSGEPAHSCCLGFGLDRWCLAIFAQYGLDIRHWPDALKSLLRGSGRSARMRNTDHETMLEGVQAPG